MKQNQMLKKIQNFDAKTPKWKSTRGSYYWSLLFLYDQLFGITARVKNSNEETVTKENSKTKIGKKLSSTHLANTKKLVAKNKDFNYDQALALPHVSAEEFDSLDFQHWKSKVGRPLVIKNFLKNAPVLDLMSKENLIANYGDEEIKCVKILRDPDKISYVGQNQTTVDTTLKEYLTSDEFKDYYINNYYGIIKEEDFLDACKGDELNKIMGKPNAFTQWFISRPEEGFSGAHLHCAPADNMFLNIKGRKEWVFVDPSYTPIMKPALSKHGVFCVSELEQPLEGDFYAEFVKRYPHMKHVPIYKTVLEEGDVLFNPPWWWHRVTNLSDLTIGCATRYIDEKKSMTNARSLYLGMLIESMKNPKKSVIFRTIKSVKNKENAHEVIDSIFTKKAENSKEKTS